MSPRCELECRSGRGYFAAALGNLERIEEALAMIAAAETAMNNSGERFFEAESIGLRENSFLRRKAKMQKCKRQKANDPINLKS